MFNEMPEVAKDEKSDVVFFGKINANQTKFVVTRSTDAELTYRLLQPELPQLIKATEALVSVVEKHSHGKIF